MYADFDLRVNHIVAQPFLLSVKLNGEVRKHVPAFLLFTDTGPTCGAAACDARELARAVFTRLPIRNTVLFGCAWLFVVYSRPR
jgi:hypothetical protein